MAAQSWRLTVVPIYQRMMALLAAAQAAGKWKGQRREAMIMNCKTRAAVSVQTACNRAPNKKWCSCNLVVLPWTCRGRLVEHACRVHSGMARQQGQGGSGVATVVWMIDIKFLRSCCILTRWTKRLIKRICCPVHGCNIATRVMPTKSFFLCHVGPTRKRSCLCTGLILFCPCTSAAAATFV